MGFRFMVVGRAIDFDEATYGPIFRHEMQEMRQMKNGSQWKKQQLVTLRKKYFSLG